MDFNTLDKQMRRFEQSMDRPLLEGINVVARLDGHGFTLLTKKGFFGKKACLPLMPKSGCQASLMVRRTKSSSNEA